MGSGIRARKNAKGKGRSAVIRQDRVLVSKLHDNSIGGVVRNRM